MVIESRIARLFSNIVTLNARQKSLNTSGLIKNGKRDID